MMGTGFYMRWLLLAAIPTLAAIFGVLITIASWIGQSREPWIISFGESTTSGPVVEYIIWLRDHEREIHVRRFALRDGRMLTLSTDFSAALMQHTSEVGAVDLIDLRHHRTVGLGPGSNARWSPDGQRFFYTVGDESRVIARAGDGWRQIATIRLERDGYPVGWSPDGTRLLFQIDADESGVIFVPDIYVGSLDGRDRINISRSPESTDQLPAWSPDGRWIAFVGNDPDSELYLADPRGRTLRRLTFNAANDLFPQWSPDSRRIAFYSDRSGGPGLYVLDVDKPDDVIPVATSMNTFGAIVWSPDARQIAYQDGSHLWIADLETGRTRQLPNSGGLPMLLP
jgi:dipeptidyl aminopeptidase/acylaminoacyl peptidase